MKYSSNRASNRWVSGDETCFAITNDDLGAGSPTTNWNWTGHFFLQFYEYIKKLHSKIPNFNPFSVDIYKHIISCGHVLCSTREDVWFNKMNIKPWEAFKFLFLDFSLNMNWEKGHCHSLYTLFQLSFPDGVNLNISAQFYTLITEMIWHTILYSIIPYDRTT